jgi:DNA-directed RNA polymerase subunit M/transcription elongation factor TFIIS
MKFCKECDSMLYPYEENSKLFEICKNCGYKEICNSNIISTTFYKKKKQSDQSSIRYFIYDNALPYTIHKKCPNKECISFTDKSKQEAVFFNDKNNMELIYLCTQCKTQWKYS